METPSLFELQIDGESSGFLAEISKWGKFLSIVGLIMCGFLILLSFGIMAIGNTNPLIQASFQQSGYNPVVLGIVYLAMSVVSIFPYLYLYQFSTKMKAALSSSDQDVLNASFSNLKSSFKFVGIMTIIMLGFVALTIILAIIGLMATQ